MRKENTKMSCGGFNSCGGFGLLSYSSCNPPRCGREQEFFPTRKDFLPLIKPLVCVNVKYDKQDQICKIRLTCDGTAPEWFTLKEVRTFQKSSDFRVYGVRVKADGTVKIKPKEAIEKLEDLYISDCFPKAEKRLKRAKQKCEENEQKEKDQLDYDR